MEKSIHSIVSLFPDFEERIEFLFESDENFRDICKDYILCTSYIMEQKKNSNKYRIQLEEYEDVKQNLEEEIFRMLSKNEST
ncbi:hypothetical protein QRD02_04125 [Aequorivita sp. SDUM287046]|uniref:Uncharacterized protein n=1 Tax=Aequorivita aurantiaca TaxID=3053356 RepID=A0ABT8DE41_9FLAO|nr:hypothetical protein [Aequorivita aurantiaca]MDN3723557.1 hypothetical protein [Aequorivita aurantiaca]